MTLTDFLLARIAEDVEAATPGEGWNTEYGIDDVPVQFWDYGEVHIGHKRFLAECEAKRQQIAHLIRFMEGDYAPWNEEQLQIMATVYADHPDYREEWKP